MVFNLVNTIIISIFLEGKLFNVADSIQVVNESNSILADRGIVPIKPFSNNLSDYC